VCLLQADVDKDGNLEVEELNYILTALEKDGIRISDLSYEKVLGGGGYLEISFLLLSQHQCIDRTEVGQRLLEEYATNKSGTLTREEFMVLADLIMRHYEEGYARTVMHTLIVAPLSKESMQDSSFLCPHPICFRANGGSASMSSKGNSEAGPIVWFAWPSIRKLVKRKPSKSSNVVMSVICLGSTWSSRCRNSLLVSPCAVSLLKENVL